MDTAPPIAAELPAGSPVRAGYIAPQDTYPLVITPVPGAGKVDLAAWAAENRTYVDANLLAHGALLFRGFDITSPAAFERVAGTICPGLFGEYGDLPREGVSGKVYGSTPYPANQPIHFHNESSHLPRWPQKQFFACMQASQTGGETPLLDCRHIARVLDPAILSRFAEKGLLYVRNFCEDIDVSWQHFFKTDDKKAVEKICADGGMTCEWVRGRTLRIKQKARAVVRHPRTGETVFFNQVQLHHPFCLDPATRKSLVALFKEDGLPRNVYYGDGSKIEDATMAELDRLYWQTAKAFPWQNGDMIMLDNMLVAHARKPFTGARKIVVAMGEMVNGEDVMG
ncbi:Siderophore biosynthesis non-ribosomal peptide synthetase [Minicystis rosea]|nr:Siderophore biosynthesis non-ribosomal peptide synthetase [Minicystis rosea]